MKVYIVINLILIFAFSSQTLTGNNSEKSSLKIKIEFPRKSGKFINQDLIDFIEDTKRLMMSTIPDRNKLVMVMGMSGTGKSTLVNYLNNIPLVWKKSSKGTWVIELQSENVTLPGGFSIGHLSSETFYPASYSPPGKDFSYIDNPGFKDTRGTEVDVANGFFRQEITKQTKELKFLLLLTYSDLMERGQQFRESISGFTDFLGILDANDPPNILSTSIGIIVTKVNNRDDTREDVKNTIIERLKDVLNDEIQTEQLSNNENAVFKEIIDNQQVELFYQPNKPGLIETYDKIEILKLIDKLKFISKDDVKLRVRIDSKYIPKLLKYLDIQRDVFQHNLINELKMSISRYVEKTLILNSVSEATIVYQVLKQTKMIGLRKVSFDEFIDSIHEEIINNTLKESFRNKRKLIDYFVEIIPQEYIAEEIYLFTHQKQWINVELNDQLISYLDDIIVNVGREYNAFEKNIENILISSLNNYFPNAVNHSVYIDDIKTSEKILKNIQTNGIIQSTLTSFLKNINNSVLNENNKKEILNKYIAFENFTKESFVQQHNRIPLKKAWISTKTNSKIDNLIYELERYDDKGVFKYNKDTGDFIYYGYFVNLSYIQNEVTKTYMKEKRINLKSVRIYTTHSLILDTDYSINKDFYQTHAPDLVIITPNLMVNKLITIDLSCGNIPDYPDGKIMAKDATQFGGKGENGKPGLPGYNGGNLLIFSNNVVNISNINFISTGGTGGPGQNGGNGREGRKGSDANDPQSLDCMRLYASYQQPAADVAEMIKIYEHSESFKLYMKTPCNLPKKPYVLTPNEYYEHILENTFSNHNYKVYVNGNAGLPGGDGGQGGSGGLSGYGGRMMIRLKLTTIWRNTSINGYKGRNGHFGKPGLQGLDGNLFRRRYHVSVSLRIRYGWEEGSLITVDSRDNKMNGKEDYRINDIGIYQPTQTEIELFDKENEYVKFLCDIDSRFKNSLLLHNNFIKNVIDYDDDDDLKNVSILIRRFEIFSGYESYHLLPNLKNKAINYYNKLSNQEINSRRNVKIVLDYTIAALTSVIMRHNSRTSFVVNLEKYLDSTKNEIKEWNSLAKLKLRETYVSDYENNLKKKIADANKIIDNLKKDIENSENNVNSKIESVLNELTHMKNVTLDKGNNLIKKKQALGDTLAKKTLFSILRMGCQMLSFLGPKGALIGNIAQFGVDAVAITSSVQQSKSQSVSPNLEKSINEYRSFVKGKDDLEMKKIEKDLKILETVNELKNKNGFDQKTLKSSTISLEQRIKNLPESISKYEIQLKFVNLDKNIADPKIHEIKVDEINAKIKKLRVNTIDTLTASTALTQTARVVLDIYNERTIGQNEIDAVQEEIEKNQAKMKQIYDMENMVNNLHEKMLKEAENEINELINSLSNSSRVVLKFKKFQIKQFMIDLKNGILKLFNELESKNELLNTYSRIENAIQTMIDVYDCIESFIEQSVFAKFIADITNTDLTVGIPIEYQNDIIRLSKKLLENLIMERYDKAINAFKFWSFPFYSDFNKNGGLESYNNDKLNTDNVESIISWCSSKLNDLLRVVRNADSEINPKKDNRIHTFLFDKNTPFYTWSSKNNPIEIKNLLKGETVTLFANVNDSRFDVVKFRTLYLTIQIDEFNASQSVLLNKTLENMHVELIHGSDSFYRYKNEIYMISYYYNADEKLSLKYKYGCNENCEIANESFMKLSRNKPVLSPYTFWEITLKPIKSENRVSLFKTLDSISAGDKNIVVYLCGFGQYLE